MKPYEQAPFTNRIGQVIQPGDTILIVTGGQGNTIHTRTGTYLGRRLYKAYLDPLQPPWYQTVVKVDAIKYVWVDRFGTPCRGKDQYTLEQVAYKRHTSLLRNRIFKLA